MMRDDIQDHQAVLYSSAGGNLVAQHNLFAVVMHAGSENEFSREFARIPSHQSSRCRASAARLKDGPASEATRNFLHVFLCVSAINAERVQFHQLARVIFVDAAS